MKTQKKTIFVKVEYWECGYEDHRHKTKKIAQACIIKQESKKPAEQTLVKHQRYIHCAKLILNGSTAKKAGEEIGVSGCRALQILRQIIMRSRKPIHKLPCLEYSPWAPISELREDKKHLLIRVDAVAKEWGVQ